MLIFQGPTWYKARNGPILPASQRFDGSRSRKTAGSLADTLQCNIWRRAQTPNMMTHCMHGGDNHGKFNGFTALCKTIGTSKSTQKDSDYVKEHSVLKYFRKKLACYLHDFRDHGTIPAVMRNRKKDLFEYGKCDDIGRPGTGSKLYYINSWAMCWPSDHPKKPLTG